MGSTQSIHIAMRREVHLRVFVHLQVHSKAWLFLGYFCTLQVAQPPVAAR